MFTTGSKLLYGAALAATVGAVLYGVIDGGAIGTVGLTFAAAALFFLGGVVQFTRDANVSALDVAALHRSPAAAPAPSASVWPAVAALAGVVLVVGLVTDQIVFVLGLVVALVAGVEWMVQAWADRASADQGHNAVVRSRTAHPLEFPIFAAVGVGIIVFSFSRIMLFLSKTGGPVAFAVIAALVLAIGFVFAARPTLKSGAMGAVAVIGAVGLVAGGIASAMGGEREMHVFETTGMLAAEAKCDTAEHTEADERASQTVAAKANITGTVTLHADGTLTATALGLPQPSNTITITRNNPTNVLFRNETPEARRLVLNAGTRLEDPTDTASERVPAQSCTALAEEGGSQLLTFTIANTSATVDEPMTFTVPGVDGAMVEVVVP